MATIANPANDVFGQARDGSVAAIIQILNEKLSDEAIRTRAVFADGMLQLLCEAPSSEQLIKDHVVGRIRKILDHIAPRRIGKVHIHSRIVREQQLLWLEEIRRDPDGQVLWSEVITLKQPNLVIQLARDLQRPRPPAPVTKGYSGSDLRKRKSFIRGLSGGVAVCLLLGAGWFLKSRWSRAALVDADPSAVPPVAATAPAESISPAPSPAEQVPIPEEYDSFARAVRVAEEAAQEGKNANTANEWLELAARWRQASDLMAEVPPNDNRYRLAQDRVKAYLANSETLLERTSESQ
ncbi:MAG: hypothetical protein AAFZ80_03820 [Cyanobacteria bacterium P01_A01_bin.105]